MRVAPSTRLCLPYRIPSRPSYATPTHLPEQKPLFLPLRFLAYTNYLQQSKSARRQRAQGEVQIRPERSESIKPESYREPDKAKHAEVPKTDALLAEQNVSNKEQRRADWIIIKEMAKYIWPKVWLVFKHGLKINA